MTYFLLRLFLEVFVTSMPGFLCLSLSLFFFRKNLLFKHYDFCSVVRYLQHTNADKKTTTEYIFFSRTECCKNTWASKSCFIYFLIDASGINPSYIYNYKIYVFMMRKFLKYMFILLFILSKSRLLGSFNN